MIPRFTRVAGLVLTVACWLWARDVERSRPWDLVLIWGAPLLQYPITLLGRQWLDARPDAGRVEWASIFVHYAMMIALGVAIFPAVRSVQRQPGSLPIPQQIGQVLVWVTALATSLTVLNLAIRGLGAPFAAKLSSRLATDWMYAWTRNPMLLCTLALLLSVGLRYRSTWFLLWVVVIVSPGWIFFVRRYEERELEIRFGTSYLEYKARTPLLWPRKPARNHEMPTAGCC
jgi:protein-S-isoprenylcysteine O-methyltransferase Ste14